MDSLDEVFKSQWHDWKQSKITKKLVKDIFNKREMIKEGWAEGQHEDQKQEFLDKGRCMAMKDIIDYILYEFETIDDSPQEESKDGN